MDFQTTDSAASASAMFTGVKTKEGTLGFDESVNAISWHSMETARKVDSIMVWAQDAGMDTGKLNLRTRN